MALVATVAILSRDSIVALVTIVGDNGSSTNDSISKLKDGKKMRILRRLVKLENSKIVFLLTNGPHLVRYTLFNVSFDPYIPI